MRQLGGRLPDVRIEVVTTTFVASGRPEGVHDLGRFLEGLNNPAMSRYIELHDAAIRPLYRAQAAIDLDAPMLVRRDEIVFANFEGPYFMHGAVRPAQIDAPALLMAPPFQIAGTIAIAPGADATAALRSAVHGFLVVQKARVFDAEGNDLGQGDQIIVNGAAVQMTSSTRRHIAVAPAKATLQAIERDAAMAESPAAETERAA
ncbi:MAG: hypothetical protein M3P30_10920 [Chloroflexota bacterium]|nr:hypothetical protein [Chloroflexota bacterium]